MNACICSTFDVKVHVQKALISSKAKKPVNININISYEKLSYQL